MATQYGSGPATGDVEPAEAPAEVEQVGDQRPCLFRYITAICRTFGLLTLALLWGCAVYLIQKRKDYVYTPWYILGLAIFIGFFEVVWILNKMTCCADDGNCCCTTWRAVVWVDNWKKTIVYGALSIPTFVSNIIAFPAIACGLAIIVLALLYMLKSFKESDCVKRKKGQNVRTREVPSAQAPLVSHEVQAETEPLAPESVSAPHPE